MEVRVIVFNFCPGTVGFWNGGRAEYEVTVVFLEAQVGAALNGGMGVFPAQYCRVACQVLAPRHHDADEDEGKRQRTGDHDGLQAAQGILAGDEQQGQGNAT